MITEFSEHEADRGETQECQGIAGEVFKVLGQSPASVEPGEGAFDNPTLWENPEAFGVIRPFDDFDFEVRKRFGQSLLKDRPLISAIGESFANGCMPNRVERTSMPVAVLISAGCTRA